MTLRSEFRSLESNVRTRKLSIGRGVRATEVTAKHWKQFVALALLKDDGLG